MLTRKSHPIGRRARWKSGAYTGPVAFSSAAVVEEVFGQTNGRQHKFQPSATARWRRSAGSVLDMRAAKHSPLRIEQHD
jgi:hypothetical protein